MRTLRKNMKKAIHVEIIKESKLYNVSFSDIIIITAKLGFVVACRFLKDGNEN